MNERDFCYWLQGLFELQDPDFLNEKTTKIIKDHLALVFKKETPNYFRPIKDLKPIKDFTPQTLEFTCDTKFELPTDSMPISC